jgi:GDP-D-mannose dehydratase
MKKALICGISGQDGAYLAQRLLNLGYAVCGTSRDAQISSFQNLIHLGLKDQVKLESMSLTDFRSVLQVLTKFQPDEVYNLAGQTSAFTSVNLDWHDYVIVDRSLFRPTDLAVGRGNPHKAKMQLGWEAKYKMQDVVRMMVDAKLRSLSHSA